MTPPRISRAAISAERAVPRISAFKVDNPARSRGEDGPCDPSYHARFLRVLPQSSVGSLLLTRLRARVSARFRESQIFRRIGPSRVKNRTCLNPVCPSHENVGGGNVVRHGFYRTKSGKRRRYRCAECGMTFSSTKGTPYYRLQHRRATFDAVVALRVEGVSISATARKT